MFVCDILQIILFMHLQPQRNIHIHNIVLTKCRKNEIHGLKDILVRENDNRVRETEELRMAMELGTQQLVEAIEKETSDRKKQVKNVENEFSDAMKKDKSDLVGKIETANDEMKKKMEMETNEIRYYFRFRYTSTYFFTNAIKC